MGEYAHIGRLVRKPDALEKITGRALYGPDLVLPDLLVGRILYSPFPHARIVRLDIERARRVPGVRAILTGADVPDTMRIGFERDNPPLKRGKVRSARDEVAAVAATSGAAAEEALDLIRVEYEELAAVLDLETALQPGAPLVHEERGTNALTHLERTYRHGEVARGLAESDAVVEGTFVTPYVSHAAMGTTFCICAFDAAGRLTVWSPTQVPFLLQRDLSQCLGIPGERIRVIQPTIGGAFGRGLDTYPIEPICALLARATGQPVRIAFSREEEFRAAPLRQPAVISIRSGVRRDGTLLARQVHVGLDAGAYVSWGALSTWMMVQTFASFYRVKHVEFTSTIAYTNNPITGSMRGYGNPQAHFALESHMDEVSEALGMDPVELRLRNANRPEETTPQGLRITTCGIRECIERAASEIGWASKRGRQRGRTGIRRGVGLAGMFHVGGGSRIYRSDGGGAIVKVDDFGKVTLITGASEMGQGSDASLAQIVAEILAVPYEAIQVVHHDTDVSPWDAGSHASRTTFINGRAAAAAAREARAQILEAAAELLRAPAEAIELRDGHAILRDDPTARVPIERAVRARHFRQGGRLVMATAFYDPQTELMDAESRGNVSATYAFGAQAAEVEVDCETGIVRVLRIVAAHDVGKVINLLGLEGNIEGGAATGLGYALFEECVVEGGQLRNPTFIEYHLPTAADVPPVQITLIETEDPEGPFGAKGIGEAAAISAAPAIANAIFDATGRRIRRLPLTPERVLRAISGELG